MRHVTNGEMYPNLMKLGFVPSERSEECFDLKSECMAGDNGMVRVSMFVEDGPIEIIAFESRGVVMFTTSISRSTPIEMIMEIIEVYTR